MGVMEFTILILGLSAIVAFFVTLIKTIYDVHVMKRENERLKEHWERLSSMIDDRK